MHTNGQLNKRTIIHKYMKPGQNWSPHGRFEKLERRLFPNDSPYQRGRRRAAFFFGALGLILLVLGVARVITDVSAIKGPPGVGEPTKIFSSPAPPNG